ncbi:ADP-ribosylation factor-like protein 13B isoform X2 [Ceratina calcarata]|uniref:ADP-ribosylation factor-like protein 13B isoform X2 n=1 Tax=Ceratina calcarata TaxID=156304 RepID=A0AAJ7WBK8_9HYME|nr:ADP-ribosylation factor-like protein 13B isoform X2 [Ceratina calcarata]
MGNCIRSVLRRLQRKRCSEKTIILLIVGLDNAGKTTILNQINGDSDETVLPTMGFHTVSMKYKSYTVKIYDIGGSSQIRSLWPKYYNGIHGLIYVVDASDISRLTENKVVFGELISHEYISGKPLLLLANKQDVNGAIDELDVVENLDVERAANTMKCPTRVEICSCLWKGDESKDNTIGIKNGYNKIKSHAIHDTRSERNTKVRSIAVDSPSRLSIHSNPFKPIKELISQKENTQEASVSQNGIVTNGKKLKKIFVHTNKTGPLPTEDSIIEIMPENVKFTKKNSLQTLPSILNPATLDTSSEPIRLKTNRPCTAPGRTHCINKIAVTSIPGQVNQK